MSAELVKRISQTLADNLQIGISGPILKKNGGVLQVRNSSDSVFERIQAASPTSNEDVVTKGSLASSVQIMEYAFPAGIQIENPAYSLLCTMIFRGTAQVGSPANVFIVGGKDPGFGGSVRYRIYDRTNNLVIVESAEETGDFPYLINMGTISNLPSGLSMWEMQGKKVSGSAKAILGAISVGW